MIAIGIVSCDGMELDALPPPVTFGEAGGDIGRSNSCTLVLADVQRRISRKHALIAWRDGQHFIRQIGSIVDIELNGARLAVDTDYALEPGAEIRIGPYLLRASAVAAAALQELDLVVGEPTGAGVRPAVPSPETVPRALAQDDGFVALYAGLKMAVPAPAQRSAEQLALIGALLRKAIEGVLQLLAVRTIAKRELGASRTLLQTRENNPLKFSPNVDAALVHLLGPAQRGFIAPLTAVGGAFDDLRAHEVAMLSGMRAALDEVLSRFDPKSLEQRLGPRAMWESLLPASRKAKLWESYDERYTEIVQEIEGDFDSLFGRAFLRAYEQQLAQLSRSAQAGAPDER